MVSILYFLIAALIGYICGAIPFGYLYVRLVKGIDIRTIGSGRTGGTNSLRAAGLGVGLATSFSDVGKGALGLIISRWLLSNQLSAELLPWALATAGVMSVIGHNWSVFMGWRGGAGTGPNVGWGTALWWPMLPIAIVVMSGMILGLGMASIASLSMGAILVIVFFVLYLAGVPPFDASLAYIVGGLVAFAIIAWALRPNIKRLLSGNERIVGPRARRLKRKQEENL
ncbi:Acyl-phosphate:glycerol-3-phosphate O-acyltransferase PlsY [hydrothermal vent metagenome]|uniref:Acyl-phosphate:glycerol-3-phosphate O-acyltransferase PlsY n=1 Tax=hydrothermal vent metagenome TaxID=652676 RepID=A0A3B0VIM5_9ZZZZ